MLIIHVLNTNLALMYVFASIFVFQIAKWYPLLHSKYGKNKPEMKLSLYIDDDAAPSDSKPASKTKTSPGKGNKQ